jgi:hypothetical protein
MRTGANLHALITLTLVAFSVSAEHTHLSNARQIKKKALRTHSRTPALCIGLRGTETTHHTDITSQLHEVGS